MLEALVSLRHAGEPGLKKRGDILVVMLPEFAPWTDMELSFHTVIEIEDEDLEAQLRVMSIAGEPFPKLIHPYAEYDAKNNMIKRSTKRLDFDKMDASMRADILNKDKKIPKVKKSKVKIKRV